MKKIKELHKKKVAVRNFEYNRYFIIEFLIVQKYIHYGKIILVLLHMKFSA